MRADHGLTADDVRELTSLLRRLPAGWMPEPVFIEICRLTPMVALEWVPMRFCDGQPEVLLLSRPEDDPVWPGMLHTPGTVLRPTDVTLDDAAARLQAEELDGIEIQSVQFIGVQYGHGQRGSGITLEHLAVVSSAPDDLFHPADDLPDGFIAEQLPMIQRASAALTASR